MLLQAISIAAWWVWLFRSADALQQFAPHGSEYALLAFAPADLVLLCVLAICCSVAVLRRSSFATAALWCHAGAAAYASLWAFALAYYEPTRLHGALLMLPLFIASLAAAVSYTMTYRTR